VTKRDGQPNKNHLARIEADKRRRHVMNLHDHSGLTFKEIGKLLGFSATRASQMYYMGQWRSDEWRKREDAARRWKSIASDMVTELDLREAFRRELEQDRASRNAAMPKQQTKPYDVIPHCLERVISG
jgi:hypothetical protein